MSWFFNLNRSRKHSTSEDLLRTRQELEATARELIRTDWQLHRANDRFNIQISQLYALHRVGTLINSTFDLEVIFNTVVDSMSKDLGFDKTGIVFLDKTGARPLQSAYKGFSSTEYRLFLDHFEDLVKNTIQQEEVCLQTISHANEAWGRFLRTLGIDSLMLLPMRIKTRLIGFIVGGKANVTLRLSEADRRFYCMYSGEASSAIENARLYEALGQANLTLEQKVQERTKDLVEANERLRELDTVKSNFISLVSHELRTPLTAIKGFVSTLLHYGDEIPEDKKKMYLGILNEETDRLTRLITELLDISRIESGKVEMKWQKVTLPAVVQKVFDALAMNKPATLELIKDFPDDFPEFMGDIDKIEQIFVNLVMNAIRFSPVNGAIRVSGRILAEGGVRLEVQDQGPGIPFAQLEKIFDKFFRADNDVNRKCPGTGLGLPICRALANLHGGKIWAESEVGQGTRMIVTLPLNRDKTETPSTHVSNRRVA